MSSEQDNDDLLVINTYPDMFSAEVAKGALEAAGIRCFIRSEAVSSVYPLWIQPGFGPELVVLRKDYAAARAVLGFQQ